MLDTFKYKLIPEAEDGQTYTINNVLAVSAAKDTIVILHQPEDGPEQTTILKLSALFIWSLI